MRGEHRKRGRDSGIIGDWSKTSSSCTADCPAGFYVWGSNSVGDCYISLEVSSVGTRVDHLDTSGFREEAHVECVDPPPTTLLGIPIDEPPRWESVGSLICSGQNISDGSYSDAECMDDIHCSSTKPNKPYCKVPRLGNPGNYCVECADDTHCDSGERCANSGRCL